MEGEGGRGESEGQGGMGGERNGGGREGGRYPFTESRDCWEPLVSSRYNQGL